MRVVVAILLALHGLAHLVGFRLAFWPPPAERPTPAGTKVNGLLWLLIATGFIGCAGLFLARHESWQFLLLLASGGSIVLCLLYWPQAKLGLFVDVVLILVALLAGRSTGSYVEARFARELRAASMSATGADAEIVDERAIASLPTSVRAYLRFMGAVGRPRNWSLRAQFNARFRRLDGEWQRCEALQYDTRLPLSRRFFMQLSLGGVLPVTVRDTYVNGAGKMSAKAFDLFDVADGSGHELDVGELVTYLNDAILMAPSLLLDPNTTWTEVDPHTFDVALRDRGLQVVARVWLDSRGAPMDFSTTDRFLDMANGKRVRTEWRTPIVGWQEVRGRKLPTRAQAVWQLPAGPFAYADFVIDSTKVAFDVPPA